MRSDNKYEEMVNEAKQFANHQNLTEVNFKESRKRTKKIYLEKKLQMKYRARHSTIIDVIHTLQILTK
ncbi:zinc finger MYM-type protein 1-like [Aphis craccivora]|uniref:Zinc finger MYM-type protein 1-like n=1 Tax=Aphis craccivora TaxID=307492 RepID=A0A6G0W152_APHCR|nr:zinc finger MYM-type protein 1-like [Aphis craccivora]